MTDDVLTVVVERRHREGKRITSQERAQLFARYEELMDTGLARPTVAAVIMVEFGFNNPGRIYELTDNTTRYTIVVDGEQWTEQKVVKPNDVAYILRHPRHGIYKLGHGIVKSRSRTFRSEVVCVEPGGEPRERQLHARFWRSRIPAHELPPDVQRSGEWFRGTPDLLRYIREHTQEDE